MYYYNKNIPVAILKKKNTFCKKKHKFLFFINKKHFK